MNDNERSPALQPELQNLQDLWKRVLGDPILSDQQFVVWSELYRVAAMRRGIAKAAAKNMQMGGQMSQEHRLRFASKVMETMTTDPQKVVGQKPRPEAA
jgi:hypothetical protein